MAEPPRPEKVPKTSPSEKGGKRTETRLMQIPTYLKLRLQLAYKEQGKESSQVGWVLKREELSEEWIHHLSQVETRRIMGHGDWERVFQN